MNALELYARYLRLKGHTHNAQADYFAAEGDTEKTDFYRHMAQDYFRMATETEAEAMEDAA